jgi:anti-anti-sigma factor
MSLESPHFTRPDDPPLLVRIDHDDRTATVRMTVSGELDDVSAGRLREGFLGALRGRRPAVVEVNVRGVTFLDSAGIRALVLCRIDATRADCRIRVVDAPHIVHRVLEISGLLEYLGVSPAGSAPSAAAGAAARPAYVPGPAA